jgi:hypothetical protein
VAILDEAEDPRYQVRLQAEKFPGGLAVSRASDAVATHYNCKIGIIELHALD